MDIAAQIKNYIGDEALAAVSATNVQPFDDIDTPGLQFDVEVNGRQLRVIVTLQPTEAYKVYVFDPATMETLRDEPDVDAQHLTETINTLEVTL